MLPKQNDFTEKAHRAGQHPGQTFPQHILFDQNRQPLPYGHPAYQDPRYQQWIAQQNYSQPSFPSMGNAPGFRPGMLPASAAYKLQGSNQSSPHGPNSPGSPQVRPSGLGIGSVGVYGVPGSPARPGSPGSPYQRPGPIPMQSLPNLQSESPVSQQRPSNLQPGSLVPLAHASSAHGAAVIFNSPRRSMRKLPSFWSQDCELTMTVTSFC
jgi:hypothetical protein